MATPRSQQQRDVLDKNGEEEGSVAAEALPFEDREELKGATPKSDKKSKKRRRQVRKTPEVEDPVDYPILPDMLEPALENVASEEIEAPPASVPKKRSKSRKTNGRSKRRTRATPDIVEAAPTLLLVNDYMEENEDLLTSLNKAQSTPQPEPSNPRRSQRIASTEPEVSNIATRTRSRESSIDQTSLPPKIKAVKAKARTYTRNSRKDIYDVPEEEDHDSVDIYRQPMVSDEPVHSQVESPHGKISQRKRDDQVVPPIIEDAEEELQLPQNPSSKALGKRKASDAVESNKKRKRKNKEPTRTQSQLLEYGFHSDESRSQRDRSHSILNPTPQDLALTAQRLYAEAEAEPSPPQPSRPQETISSQLQNPTQWTPINSPDLARTVVESRLIDPSSPKVTLTPLNYLKSPSPASEINATASKSSKKRKRRLPTMLSSSAVKSTKSLADRSISKTPKREISNHQAHANRTKTTNEDLEEMSKAVEAWREEHDMTQREVNDLVQRAVDAKSKKFWDHMEDQLPGIPRAKLQQRCRRKFHNFERGPFSEDDDRELGELYEKYPKKWKQIGELMNRFPEDCRDRWRNYVICGDKQRKDVWDKEEEENLRVAVAECVEMIREGIVAAGEAELALADEEKLIDWTKVSEKMGFTRSRLQCSSKWKGLKERMQSDAKDVVAEAPISDNWRLEEAEEKARLMSARQKLDLLYAIRETSAGSEGKIPWVLIVRDMLKVKGMRMALRVCYRTMKHNIQGHEDMKLQEIIDELIDAYEEAAPKEPKGFDKSFKASQQSIMSSGSKPLMKHKRRKNDTKDDVNKSSLDDNGEGSSSVKKLKFSQPRESPNTQKLTEGDSDLEGVESSLPPKAAKSKLKAKANGNVKGKKSEMMEEVENDKIENSELQPKKKKKLRHRMKPVEEKASQETNDDVASIVAGDDLENVLGAMKTGKAKASKRSHNKAAHRGQQLSAQYIHSSDDNQDDEESYPVADELRPEDGDQIGFGRQDGEVFEESQPENDNQDLPADDAIEEPESEAEVQHKSFLNEVEESLSETNSNEDYTAPSSSGEGENGLIADGEREESAPIDHSRASIDLDADNDEDENRITMDGWQNEDKLKGVREEDEDGDVEEDDDDEQDYDEDEESEEKEEQERRRNSTTRLDSPISFNDQESLPSANRYTEGSGNGELGSEELSQSSDDSDMSDIPAMPKWKKQQTRSQESSPEL
jgi:hypothetical protein